MSPGGDAKPEATGFGPRLFAPGRTRSFSAFRPTVRLAALWEAFLVAAGSLRQNKLRTALTLVGIIVGVTAVIAVVTIIKGLDQTVAQTFSSQGSTVFTISKRPRVITSREDFIKYNKRKDITEEDAERIFRLCTNCWRTGVAANDIVTLKHGNQRSDNVNVRAIARQRMTSRSSGQTSSRICFPTNHPIRCWARRFGPEDVLTTLSACCNRW